MRVLLIREWLFFVSLLLYILTSFLTGRLPCYSEDEYEILFLLFTLFVVIEGMRRSRFLEAVALKIEGLGFGAYALIAATFLISLCGKSHRLSLLRKGVRQQGALFAALFVFELFGASCGGRALFYLL